jgi:hypothetical protein
VYATALWASSMWTLILKGHSACQVRFPTKSLLFSDHFAQALCHTHCFQTLPFKKLFWAMPWLQEQGHDLLPALAQNVWFQAGKMGLQGHLSTCTRRTRVCTNDLHFLKLSLDHTDPVTHIHHISWCNFPAGGSASEQQPTQLQAVHIPCHLCCLFQAMLVGFLMHQRTSCARAYLMI